jgi:ankyrin repeat protein
MSDAGEGPILHERFLAAVREHRPFEVLELLERDAELAGRELCVDCARGDDARVATWLARDPEAAARPRAPGDWPPLLYASASPLGARSAAEAEALARVVTRLLAAGASPNTYVLWQPDDEHSRLPALYYASSLGNAAVARVLLEHGAEPNDGESIYHAAEFFHERCLELLLQHGGDVSGRHARWHNTPLYFNLGHREGGLHTATADRGIRWLLEHGADPEVTSGEDVETALHCAARVGRRAEIVAWLVAHGAQVSRRTRSGATPYALALRHGHVATAASLADHGADVNAVRDVDRLIAACAAADAAAAHALLARAPDLVRSLGDEAGEVLGRAVERGETAPVALLLELGFPAEGVPGAGETPLHRAAWHGRHGALALLLTRKVRVNVRDHTFGCSALAWACHGSANCRDADPDYVRCVDLLIDAGADRTTAINRWGAPPESMGTPVIAQRLAERGLA